MKKVQFDRDAIEDVVIEQVGLIAGAVDIYGDLERSGCKDSGRMIEEAMRTAIETIMGTIDKVAKGSFKEGGDTMAEVITEDIVKALSPNEDFTDVHQQAIEA
ncbi:hypothetical protein GO013_16440 [Pseudodesulfovibrio sp. JC047]|uniref:hypothetical protein n=1 Tax=Pseudodesulfovibrio sp. JC047 TaxID=2683199 RepID=UPI0013D7ECA5|nr:hypothetical protein [Pseudodesulfovibrio sp. JC047]NDV21001.1 hypothetical protein [Pseudodesulfovibrio sp. JC047]